MPKAACRQCGACIEGMDHHCPFIGELRRWPAAIVHSPPVRYLHCIGANLKRSHMMAASGQATVWGLATAVGLLCFCFGRFPRAGELILSCGPPLI